jgi:putative aldouronate transport system permease protein
MEVKFLNLTTNNKNNTVNITSKSNFGRTMNKIWKDKPIYLILLPGIIYFLVFNYVPMYGAIIAFKDFKAPLGIMGSKWVGLKNFIDFFNHPSFGLVLINTMVISFYKIIIGFPAPIILALLLNEVKHKLYKKSIQTISYMPHFLSWVVIAGLSTKMLSPSSGAINQLISFLGFEPIYFMAEPKYFRGILVLTDIWKEIGWGSIIYLAALSGVDVQLYEAATVDGASKWRQLWSITIPSIAPTIVIMFILRVGGVMNAGFEQIYMMYSPNVYAVSDIIDTFVYRNGLESAKYSFATAIGLFKSVIAFVLVLITNRLSKLMDDNNGLW